MLIIGCDFHPGLQQVTIFDNQSGEYQEKRLGHREEAERFYGSLSGAGAGGDGSVRTLSMVRARAGESQLRALDRRAGFELRMAERIRCH